MEYFVVDYEVFVVVYEEEDNFVYVIIFFEICQECLQQWENMIEMVKYVYRDVIIFVWKVVKDK